MHKITDNQSEPYFILPASTCFRHVSPIREIPEASSGPRYPLSDFQVKKRKQVKQTGYKSQDMSKNNFGLKCLLSMTYMLYLI